MNKNYYKILKVNKNDDAQTIKNAYVEQVINDQFEGQMTTNQKDDLAVAYQVLSDPKMKEQYDKQGSSFNSDKGYKFKSGQELYNEKSKIPNFFSISKSYTYESSEQHTYKDGKHFAQKHALENWTDGEKKEGRKIDKEIVYKNDKPIEIVTESKINPDGSIKTQRKELMDDGKGGQKILSIENYDQQSQ